jgi:hypothetical protein
MPAKNPSRSFLAPSPFREGLEKYRMKDEIACLSCLFSWPFPNRGGSEERAGGVLHSV